MAAGRKARKTTFIVNQLMIHALADTRGLSYPIIGPTRVQEKEIVWDDHVAQNLRMLARLKIPHEVNKSDLSVSFPGHGKFMVDGSDNVESLRGKSDWGGIGMDEFAFWSNPQYAWEEVIEPNLIVNHAWAMISSTTNGYDYFHRLVKRGDHINEIEGTAFDDEMNIVEPNKYYKSYRYTSFDNPFLDAEWLNSKKDTMSLEAFNREYLARFEKQRGLVYKEFDRRIHVKTDLDISYTWNFYRTMDFGAVNPTVCLWIVVDNVGTVYVIDEYYNSGLTAQNHANIINAKTSPETNILTTWGDPSAKQEMLDYASFGVIISPANKTFDGRDQDWVKSGIERVKEFLKPNPQTGRPRLIISPKCVNTIREFESYHWHETSESGIIKDIPEKVDDHCMDALRYFIVSYTQPVQEYERFTPLVEHNNFTGY